MYIKCSKCGESLRLYGEGIADLCHCPKKPIGLYLENDEIRFFGPKKKIEIVDERNPNYTTSPIKYFAAEVYKTVKIIVITEATSLEEAAENIDTVIEQDLIDFSEATSITENIGNIVEIDYQPTIEGEDDSDEEW